MDIIWTPWRYEYVSTVDEREGCIFCDRPTSGDDEENMILAREQYCFAMLNIYPYTTGHLMIAPYRHTGTIEELDPETLKEMMTLAQRSMEAIRKTFDPQGFNLGINISRIAGAGVTDHVHLHVVPRWSGDSNFMTVVAQTRVMPQALDQVFARLRELF